MQEDLFNRYVLDVRVEDFSKVSYDGYITRERIVTSASGFSGVVYVSTGTVSLSIVDGVLYSRNIFDDSVQQVSLYETFAYLCGWYRHNLGQYREIVFSPDKYFEKCVIIRLSESQEAKRFFTKLFMEVMT